MIMLIGLSGAIGHGKSTFADYLNSEAVSAAHYESSDIIIEVANALNATQHQPSSNDNIGIVRWLAQLPDILRTQTHISIVYDDLNLGQERLETRSEDLSKLYEYLELIEKRPELADVTIDTTNKDTFRPLLQWLGGYLAKTVSGTLWFEEIVRRAQASGAELITAGGVRFPDDAGCLRDAGGIIITIERPAAGEQDSQDVTERERNLITADTVVINSGSLSDLKRLAEHVYSDLAHNQLQAEYRAS